MSDTFPLRILAEILAADTPEAKRKVLDDYYADQAGMDRFIADYNDKYIARGHRQEAQLAALPWYRRIGKHPWDMSGD